MGCAGEVALVSQMIFNFGLKMSCPTGQLGSRTPWKARHERVFQGRCSLVLNLSLCTSLDGNSGWLWPWGLFLCLCFLNQCPCEEEKSQQIIDLQGKQTKKNLPITQNPAKSPDLCFQLSPLGGSCTAFGRRERLTWVQSCGALAMEANREGRDRLNMPCEGHGSCWTWSACYWKRY